MQQIGRKDVTRLTNFLEDLEARRPKQSYEIDLSSLGNLLNRIGFDGPHNKRGAARGFSHELLTADPMLTGGQITVHALHGKKNEVITYRDFKKYLQPFIEQVLKDLEDKGLITEENPNV
jgi:hypothetical protein